MQTLCFGGTFNPIHYGHIRCAHAAALATGFGRVMLIPSSRPPHKTHHVNLADANDRLQMCRLAVEGEPLFDCSDIETRRSSPSFTVDTAMELKKHGFAQVTWLIGADMLNTLPTWHDPARLLREVNFLIMARPGHQLDWESLGAEYQFLKANVVHVPNVPIRRRSGVAGRRPL